MKAPSYILTAILVIIIFSCSKEKYKTKPQIKIKSINPSTGVIKRAPNNANKELSIDIEFTDNEGDIGGDTCLWIKKIRRNVRQVPPAQQNIILTGFKADLPDFPRNSKAVIRYDFDFNNQLQPANVGGSQQNDTIYFRFMLQDKAGNKSDTINTNDIIIGN